MISLQFCYTDFFVLFFNLKKNDGRRMPLIQVVSKKLVKSCQCFIGFNLLYQLFDNVRLKIFCFKTKFFYEIECILNIRYKIVGVLADGHSLWNGFNHADKLLI